LRANANAISDADVLYVLSDTHGFADDFVADDASWTSLAMSRSHSSSYLR
jgi:hypothetical protein